MRLLYLSYWGLAEGLTQATVIPHLEILVASPRVESLLFVSVERGGGPPGRALEIEGVRHVGLPSRSLRPNLAARALDFIELPARLAELCRAERVTQVLARGAAPGALAHLMQRHVVVPYVVESFEPHASYMLESGVWRRWDPRYVLQRRWEAAQKREAAALLPVAESYRQSLIAEGVAPDRIITLPCTVDTERFGFSPAERERGRRGLGAPDDAIIGVYVGKFGDIYYGAEAFQVFAQFARRLAAFRLAVLTPMDPGEVRKLADEGGYPADRLWVAAVSHAEVPRYLCAADVGFATIRMAPSRRFCSPVKVGEYWASGLPVVITQGVGDDSEIVASHDAGAVISLEAASVDAAVEQVQRLWAEPGHRDRIAALARRFRSRSRVREAYAALGWSPG